MGFWGWFALGAVVVIGVTVVAAALTFSGGTAAPVVGTAATGLSKEAMAFLGAATLASL